MVCGCVALGMTMGARVALAWVAVADSASTPPPVLCGGGKAMPVETIQVRSPAARAAASWVGRRRMIGWIVTGLGAADGKSHVFLGLADHLPLPIWAAFNGSLLLLFGSHDDSTPTDLVQQRLASLPPDPQRAIVVLAGTNHLGLLCETTCLGEPDRVSRFHPQLFATLTEWANTLLRP